MRYETGIPIDLTSLTSCFLPVLNHQISSMVYLVTHSQMVFILNDTLAKSPVGLISKELLAFAGVLDLTSILQAGF